MNTYEKKYKEALSKAKDMLSYKEVRREDMEYLFPELKESEDERIRTFLNHTFTAQYLCKDKLGKWHGEPVANILAWLEKQGDKPACDWSEKDEKIRKGIIDFLWK